MIIRRKTMFIITTRLVLLGLGMFIAGQWAKIPSTESPIDSVITDASISLTLFYK